MQQFLDYMGTYRGGRRFLTQEEERRLLQTATSRFGLSLDDARSALLVGARRYNLVLESEVAEETAAFLTPRVRGEQVRRADFQAATEFFNTRTAGQVAPDEASQRVRQVVLRSGWRPAPSGWLWRSDAWFNRIPDPTPVQGSRELISTPEPATANGMPPPYPPGTGLTSMATATSMAASALVGGADPIPVLEAWRQALNARNLEQILALYSANSVLLATAEAAPRIGPPQIRAYFQRLTSYEGLNVVFQQELQRLPSAPTVVVSGLYTFSWIDPVTGEALVTPARYTFGVRRGDNGNGGGNGGGNGVTGRIILHHSSRLPGLYPGADSV